MNRIFRYLHLILRRLLGKNAATALILQPASEATHEPGKLHPESPKRISAIEAELKQQHIWQHLRIFEACEISDSRLALVHSRKYIRFLENHQPCEGKIYRIDEDTVMSHQSLQAARLGAGAAVQAVSMVMNQQAHHAFCAIRPPGHHAQSDKAGGFCLLNNIAVAAMYAIAEYRLQRIAIIDFDVHHGDGTSEIFKDDPRILLLNAFETDIFPFPQANMHEGSNPNILHTPLQKGTDSLTFRSVIRKSWLPRLSAFKPELVLLSAGFDGHRLDEAGRLNLHEADYGWLTDKIIQTASSCKGKIVSVLEGGYTPEPLAKSAAAHIRVLAGMSRHHDIAEYDRCLKIMQSRFLRKRFRKQKIRPCC